MRWSGGWPAVVPDLGQRTAGDATALSARRGDAARQKAETQLGLPQPTGGRKEYLDAEGKVERGRGVVRLQAPPLGRRAS